jgi:hypothetical protein
LGFRIAASRTDNISSETRTKQSAEIDASPLWLAFRFSSPRSWTREQCWQAQWQAYSQPKCSSYSRHCLQFSPNVRAWGSTCSFSSPE